MDDKIKIGLTKLYDYHCILLAEHGEVAPTFFLIKDCIITPMLVSPRVSVQFEEYTKWVIGQADKIDADALVLISEQCVVSGSYEDEDIKALVKGIIKPTDHPCSSQYLILAYMEVDGSKESLFGKIENDPLGVKFIKDQEWTLESISPIISS